MTKAGARKAQGRNRNVSFRFLAPEERFDPAEIVSAVAVTVPDS
jgi:hypothetical protein